MTKKILITLSLLVYVLLLIPFTREGIMSGHDVISHMIRSELLTTALRQGQIPARVADWPYLNLSQPVFNFYQPGFYYFTALPHLSGVDVSGSIYLVTALLWLLSAFLMYLFVKNLLGPEGELGAALAAAFYAFAPYHISDIFVRAAFPEAAALAFIPGLFWASERFLSLGKPAYLPWIGVFAGLIILSHTPTALMAALPYSAFLFIMFWKQGKINLKKACWLSISLLLGFLSAGFSIIPALLEQPLIHREWLHIGYYNFHNHFVCPAQLLWSRWGYGTSVKGCDDGMSFQLGILHWLAVFVILCYLLRLLIKRQQLNFSGWILVWAIISFWMGLFFTLDISQPVWENALFFDLIQYPWRFLAVATFASSILAGFTLGLITSKLYRLIAFAILIILLPTFYGWYLHPETYFPKQEFDQIMVEKPSSEFGYFPKGVQVLPDMKKVPDQGAKKTLDTFAKKSWQVEIQYDTSFNTYVPYFPGWVALVDGKMVDPKTDSEYATIEVPLKIGQHEVTVEYRGTGIQYFSNRVSILAILILAGLLLIPLKTPGLKT